jgi:hypothetical protein
MLLNQVNRFKFLTELNTTVVGLISRLKISQRSVANRCRSKKLNCEPFHIIKLLLYLLVPLKLCLYCWIICPSITLKRFFFLRILVVSLQIMQISRNKTRPKYHHGPQVKWYFKGFVKFKRIISKETQSVLTSCGIALDYIGCSFKFLFKVSVEESIVNTIHQSAH